MLGSSTPRPAVRWLVVALVLATSLGAAAGVSALPGVGGLAKKAKDKAAKAAGVKKDEATDEGTITNETIVFDDHVLELTPERLDRVVGSFKKAAAAAAGRPALVDKLNRQQEERSAIWEKDGETIMDLQRKRGDVEACRHDAVNEMANAKMQEYSQTALSDPKIRDRFTQVAAKYNSAAASGDTAAINAAQREMMAVIMPSHEDSMNAYKKCPGVPPPLPSEGKIDALDDQIAATSEEIRKIDSKISKAQSEKGGMTEEQFWVASERIQAWVAWRQSKKYDPPKTRGFTAAEIQAMEERLAELKSTLGAR